MTTPDPNDPAPRNRAEPLLTLKEAAAEIGLPYFKLVRAARAGSIPTYTLYNSRKYVRVSELLKVMSTSAEWPQ